MTMCPIIGTADVRLIGSQDGLMKECDPDWTKIIGQFDLVGEGGRSANCSPYLVSEG